MLLKTPLLLPPPPPLAPPLREYVAGAAWTATSASARRTNGQHAHFANGDDRCNATDDDDDDIHKDKYEDEDGEDEDEDDR
jgi:hypothetical protein